MIDPNPGYLCHRWAALIWAVSILTAAIGLNSLSAAAAQQAATPNSYPPSAHQASTHQASAHQASAYSGDTGSLNQLLGQTPATGLPTQSSATMRPSSPQANLTSSPPEWHSPAEPMTGSPTASGSASWPAFQHPVPNGAASSTLWDPQRSGPASTLPANELRDGTWDASPDYARAYQALPVTRTRFTDNETSRIPNPGRGPDQDLLDRPIQMPINDAPSTTSSSSQGVLGPNTSNIITTVTALAVVLALMVGCFWLFKKAAPKSMQGLPLESMEVLGNAPLTARQHLRLVRLGNRLLLLAVSDTHAQTLTEVTDPDEVQHLLEQCQGQRSSSSQQSFRSLLSESEKERATGFLGSQQDQLLTPSLANRRPLSTHTFEA